MPDTTPEHPVAGHTAWEEAADRLCAAVERRIDVSARKAAESLYEGLLNDTQDYLRENVDFNLSHELARAKGDADAARECLRTVRDYVTDAIKAEDEAEEQKTGLLDMMRSDLARIDAVITRNGSVSL